MTLNVVALKVSNTIWSNISRSVAQRGEMCLISRHCVYLNWAIESLIGEVTITVTTAKNIHHFFNYAITINEEHRNLSNVYKYLFINKTYVYNASRVKCFNDPTMGVLIIHNVWGPFHPMGCIWIYFILCWFMLDDESYDETINVSENGC